MNEPIEKLFAKLKRALVFLVLMVFSDYGLLLNAQSFQDNVDNWVATDALGRKLPTYTDVGPKRQDKIVGVFYYLWNGGTNRFVHDISQIIKEPIEANRQWGSVNAFHFWVEPEYGYYRSEDPWVLRRDLQMLSQAKVNFLYFDTTNAFLYLDVVSEVAPPNGARAMLMKWAGREGVSTPKIDHEHETKKKTSDHRIQSPCGT